MISKKLIQNRLPWNILENNVNCTNDKNKIEGILKCDECGSLNIAEENDAFICRECGLVLEYIKMEYHKPFDEVKVQHEKLNLTQIGFTHERFINGNGAKFIRLNKIHQSLSNEEAVKKRAKIEISRIFEALQLPKSLKEDIFMKFVKIRAILGNGTKYRNPDKLVPIIIYIGMKLRKYPIRQDEILNVSKISKREFNAFLLQISNYIPEYRCRDRKTYVSQKLLEISEKFGLGMDFYCDCRVILEKLWDLFKNTKEDVIAGVIASIKILCSEINDVNINSVCSHLQIRMSTIQAQIKKNIIERFKVKNFSSLVRSAEIIRDFFISRGLIEVQKKDMINKNKIDDVKSKSICLDKDNKENDNYILNKAINISNKRRRITKNKKFIKEKIKSLISNNNTFYKNYNFKDIKDYSNNFNKIDYQIKIKTRLELINFDFPDFSNELLKRRSKGPPKCHI